MTIRIGRIRARVGRRAVRPLTISELERESGLGRNTIYYYIGFGLLPLAQKASATRAVYDQAHLELLKDITRLKGEGLSLSEIRERLAERIEEAAENGEDLVARRSEATRESILQAAARRFADKGYEQTRISDICTELGLNAQQIYAHFPSKKHLFIACFEVYVGWMNGEIAEPIENTEDSAARLAWRVWAGLGLQTLTRDLQAMARVEALHPQSELRPLVRKAYEAMLTGSAEEIAAEQAGDVNRGLFDDELVAYGFLGVLENMLMRATWDRKYSSADIMRNLLSMFLAVRAVYQGRVDLGPEWESMSELVMKLAKKLPAPAELPARQSNG